MSRHYKLPVLTVVLDNSGWAAVKEATLRVYPDGEAKAGGEFGATLAPDMDFAKVAEAAGAHGELVSRPRRRRGRHRTLPRRRARRPLGGAACESDEALGFGGGARNGASCHPERSEGPLRPQSRIPRCARDDKHCRNDIVRR